MVTLDSFCKDKSNFEEPVKTVADWKDRILWCHYKRCNGVIEHKIQITKNIVRLICANGCVDHLILDNEDGEK